MRPIKATANGYEGSQTLFACHLATFHQARAGNRDESSELLKQVQSNPLASCQLNALSFLGFPRNHGAFAVAPYVVLTKGSRPKDCKLKDCRAEADTGNPELGDRCKVKGFRV